jgi:hypothetical protein
MKEIIVIYSISSDRDLSDEEIMDCLQLRDNVGVVRKVELTDGTTVEIKCDEVMVS